MNCVAANDVGAPYLRYFNHKMKREALVPLDEELLALIHGQQQRVLERYPAGIVLFPGRRGTRTARPGRRGS